MEIRVSSENAVTVIALLGRLDELATSEAGDAFKAVVDGNAARVVLNLAGVEYISSSGLRAVLMLYRALKRNQGQLKLSGLSPFVAEVFEISNFKSLFAIYRAEADAVRAFASQGA